MNRQDIERYATLFAGRGDAYGSEHGGSVKQKITAMTFHDHLVYGGDKAIGIYPLVKIDGEFMVRWGCTDIDLGDTESWPHAVNLRTVFDTLGIQAWIEVSRSKGFHVWVFADQWIPAPLMRHAFLFAHQIAGVPATEVNPKQVDDSKLKVGLGNYVRLPYPGGYEDNWRRVVLAPEQAVIQTKLHRDEFVDLALSTLNNLDIITQVADMYTPPPPKQRVDIDTNYDGDLQQLVTRLPGLAYTIFVNGPLEGADRSSTLSRLAAKAADAGFTPAETMALVVDADKRWGKFYDRADGQEQMEGIVEWAHTEANG